MGLDITSYLEDLILMQEDKIDGHVKIGRSFPSFKCALLDVTTCVF